MLHSNENLGPLFKSEAENQKSSFLSRLKEMENENLELDESANTRIDQGPEKRCIIDNKVQNNELPKDEQGRAGDA